MEAMDYYERKHELKNTDLEIRYHGTWNGNKGRMQIHLGQFMDEMSISKVRNLVKLIRENDTPDEELKIKDYVCFLYSSYDEFERIIQARIIGYEQKVKFAQIQVNDLVAYRNLCKKNTESYKNFSAQVKIAREELKQMKSHLSSEKANLNRQMREKNFLEKCLTVLQN